MIWNQRERENLKTKNFRSENKKKEEEKKK